MAIPAVLRRKNCRRVIAAPISGVTLSLIPCLAFRYCFVIVSSRFRIMLETVVHAASSRGGTFESTFDSPTDNSFFAFGSSYV